jgi:hypothetical protein
MKSKPKLERFRLKDKDIYKAALQLTNYEKNEGRRRRKKKRRGKKRLDRDVATKNGAGMAATGEPSKMLIEVAGVSKDTVTSSVGPTVQVGSDPDVTEECVPKEAVNTGVMESNSDEGQKTKKEMEGSSENATAVPGTKRKCDVLVTEVENVAEGLQQLKVRRRESPRSLKVGKDKKNGMSKRKCAVTLAAKSSAVGSRVSVGGDWNVSNVAQTTPKVSVRPL